MRIAHFAFQLGTGAVAGFAETSLDALGRGGAARLVSGAAGLPSSAGTRPDRAGEVRAVDRPVGEEPISAEVVQSSHFVEVDGVRMHYLEQGEGEPIVFLHGNPASSYLWRNVMPHLAAHGRCIAPDLVGMGASGKPDIDYRFVDHYAYLAGFLRALELERVTLVVHDWGSALGFHYLAEHAGNVRAIAFLEAILAPSRWADFPREFRLAFRLMRAPGIGWVIVSVLNQFVEGILPRAVVRRLTPAEMAHYRATFPTITSRRPVRRWPCEIPIEGHPVDVNAAVERYNAVLRGSPIPKLLLHARPGGIVREREVAWCRDNLSNLETVDVGRGIHFLQEDNPHAVGRAIAEWYARLP